MLGTKLLDADEYEAAQPYLNRVRLDGPFSNQALLSAGWASVAANDYKRAVVAEYTKRAFAAALAQANGGN